jgi:hypothetical protein
VRPPCAQEFPAVLVELTLPPANHAGRVEAEIEATDASEETPIRQHVVLSVWLSGEVKS